MAKKRQQDNRKPNHSSPTKTESQKRLTSFFVNVRDIPMLLLLVIFIFLIYGNTLGGPLVFDDLHNIKDNSRIRLTSFTLEGITTAGFGNPMPFRPVAYVSFALNYYLHQYDVLGYHLVNILIHVTTGILLYLFVKTTLSLPLLRTRYESHRWAPFVTALIWLVHPIQTQSVTYIVQRMNSMAAMFYVLSLLLYARARLAEEKRQKWALFGVCILAGMLSLGSKEIGATLPFFIFLFEWYFFQDLSWSWAKRHSFYLLIIAVIGFAYLGIHPLEKILTNYLDRDFTLMQRVLTEFRVVVFYITLLMFPHPSRLNLDHDFSISHSLIDPITTMLSIGVIIGLMALAIYMTKKERLLSFCILWFLGNLVIESSVIGLEIVFEHRTYLPSMFVSLIAVTLSYRYMKHKLWRVGILFTVVIMFSFWTYQRNSIWSDKVTLWRDCAVKSPKKARPHLNLGVALAEKEEVKEAMSHYYVALRIDPNFADAHTNLGIAFYKQGKINEAISHFSEVLRIRPGSAEAHNTLGAVLDQQGRHKEAMSHFSEALRIKPNNANAHNNLGIALAKDGKYEEAILHYEESLRIKPDYAKVHYNLGIALSKEGKDEEAVFHYKKALQINPDDAEVHNNLGNVLLRQDKLEEAILYYNETLRIDPNFADAHTNLGNALACEGRLTEAKGHYMEALRINPDDVKTRLNLEKVLRLMNKSTEKGSP